MPGDAPQTMSERTVSFLVRGGSPCEVLLGLKKRGFGAGKYAGIGGKIKAGETITRAAVRELEEEIGIAAQERDLKAMGRLTFLFPAQPGWNQVVYPFVIAAWQGEPRESVEMQPAWYDVRQIPFDKMWQDARLWLPHVLQGKPVRMRFVFAADHETVDEWGWEEQPEVL